MQLLPFSVLLLAIVLGCGLPALYKALAILERVSSAWMMHASVPAEVRRAWEREAQPQAAASIALAADEQADNRRKRAEAQAINLQGTLD